MQWSGVTGLGERLRNAREAKGWTASQAAQELRCPTVLVTAMEAEDWQRIGAPVFVRGRLGGYAELLGVAVDVDAVVAGMAAPKLQAHAITPRFVEVVERSMPRLAAVAGTVLLLPLLYLGYQMTRGPATQIRSLDPALAAVPSAPVPRAAGPVAELAPSVVPVAASPSTAEPIGGDNSASPLTGPVNEVALPATIAAGMGALPTTGLRLEFTAPTWIEIRSGTGEVVESGLFAKDDSRDVPVSDGMTVTIGNVEGTRVTLHGSEVNLEPLRAANVARFALSSGEVTPVRR